MNAGLAQPSRSTHRALRVAAACLLAALCVTPALGGASLSSVGEFNAGKVRAETDLAADRAACRQLAGNPRDMCREQARGKERVAKAELALAHTGTRKAQDDLANVKLGVAYDLARTQCNDKTGSAKNVCTQQAQAARAKGHADGKPNQRAADARRDAADDRREAAYKVAAGKCDVMLADARASCLAAARAKAGKT